MIPSGLSLSPRALLWLIPTVLTLIFLAVWAYRAIAPSLKPSARTLLTALRAAALVLIAFLLARPLLSLAGDATGKGIVVLLTDISRSMDLPADSTGGEKARTRHDVAQESSRRAARALAGRYKVVERSFAGELAPPGAADSALGAIRERSAIGDAVTQAVSGLDGVRGVVVVSDGAVTSGRDPVRAARELGLPVATVAVGEMPGADVAVLDVLANPTARVGEATPVEVRMRALGPPRRVKLEVAEGTGVLASQEVALPGGGAEIVQRLTYRPARPGLAVFEARITAGGGAAASEWTTVDNRRAYAQEVLPDKQKVLVLAGSYHWDWTWAKRAISADSAYAADHRVFARGRFERASTGGDGVPPLTAAALRPYALVALIGVDEGQLPPPANKALADYVTAGGSVVVMGGGARAGVLALANTPLGAALHIARAPGGGGGVTESGIALTEAGRGADVMRLDDDPAVNPTAWSMLAPLANLVPMAASAEDHVYATDATARVPAVLERRVGRGRALIFNGGGLYRWGFSGSDVTAPRRYERLWGNVLRALSEPAQTEPLRLVPERALVSRGEPVRLEAALQDAAFRPVSRAKVNARVSGPVTRNVELQGAGEGSYAVSLEGLPPGRYNVSATATAGGRTAGTAQATFWIDAQSAEWQDVAPDAGLLAAVARASGGVSVRPGKESSLGPALADARPRAGREATVRLWESPLMFALATFLLTSEWWIRRRRGLA